MLLAPYLISAASLFMGSASMAQDSDDWDLGRDPAQKAIVAAVSFDNFGVAARCVDGQLSVLMSGLSMARGEQKIGVSIGDEPAKDATWISTGDGTLFSLWPTSTANTLREGGSLRITVPASGNQPARRYAFDLPKSEASVAAVFEACDRSLPRSRAEADAVPSSENLAGLRWVRRPEPRFPFRNEGRTYDFGIAAISCATDRDGYLRKCIVESEYPAGAGFGRAAQYAAHQSSRVEVIEGDASSVEDRKLNFVVRFGAITGLDLQRPPSRLPNNGPL